MKREGAICLALRRRVAARATTCDEWMSINSIMVQTGEYPRQSSFVVEGKVKASHDGWNVPLFQVPDWPRGIEASFGTFPIEINLMLVIILSSDREGRSE